MFNKIKKAIPLVEEVKSSLPNEEKELKNDYKSCKNAVITMLDNKEELCWKRRE